MTEYRRAKLEGATYFSTVNCAERHGNHLLVGRYRFSTADLPQGQERVSLRNRCEVVLPEHLIRTLPPGDADYQTRWALIKAGFSRAIPVGERRSISRIKRCERGIWQRRYWEHLIRDDRDFERHVDYIHWNPVKHGWVR